jgi:hypothetical protein
LTKDVRDGQLLKDGKQVNIIKEEGLDQQAKGTIGLKERLKNEKGANSSRPTLDDPDRERERESGPGRRPQGYKYPKIHKWHFWKLGANSSDRESILRMRTARRSAFAGQELQAAGWW